MSNAYLSEVPPALAGVKGSEKLRVLVGGVVFTAPLMYWFLAIP